MWRWTIAGRKKRKQEVSQAAPAHVPQQATSSGSAAAAKRPRYRRQRGQSNSNIGLWIGGGVATTILVVVITATVANAVINPLIDRTVHSEFMAALMPALFVTFAILFEKGWVFRHGGVNAPMEHGIASIERPHRDW
jgi:hypothetical protein